jgi:glycosyltransferase involved in cell wall biosynthesis
MIDFRAMSSPAALRVAMLVSRLADNDARVLKEAKTLNEAGCRVVVLDWDRAVARPACQDLPSVRLEHIHIRSAYDVGPRQAPLMLLFYLAALRRLWSWRPAVVHCHDLDTLPAGVLYHVLRPATRLVFDAHEFYPGMMAERLPGWFGRGLHGLDRALARRAHALLTVGERLAAHYATVTRAPVAIVGNYASLPTQDPAPAASQLRVRLGIPGEAHVIAYVGVLNKERELPILIQAVQALPDWHLLLAGYGETESALKALMGQTPRLHFLGRVPAAEVLTVYAAADVVYYGLRADHANHYFSAPNSLFNALASGRPLLTTPVGEVSEIVDQLQVGLVLPEASPAAIAAALRQLASPETRERLSANARRMARERFNWEHASSRLIAVYRGLGVLPKP